MRMSSAASEMGVAAQLRGVDEDGILLTVEKGGSAAKP